MGTQGDAAATLWSIYTLSDPRDGGVRYVGITKLTLATRLGCHLRRARLGDRSHRDNWLRELLAISERPVITLLEQTDDRDRERHWIAELRRQGLDLVNTTIGGEGCVGLPAEARARIAEASRQRLISAATREKLSRSRRGTHLSDVTREKLRQANLGKVRGPHSPATRLKISEAKRGHEVSAETRDKIRAALAGRPTGRRRTHCVWGHEYTGDNTFINIRDSQECRTCLSVRYERRQATRRSALQ